MDELLDGMFKRLLLLVGSRSRMSRKVFSDSLVSCDSLLEEWWCTESAWKKGSSERGHLGQSQSSSMVAIWSHSALDTPQHLA